MAVETVAPPRSVLSDELIRACAERAAIYGRENRFFTDDFDALRAAGYLSGELQFVVTTTGFRQRGGIEQCSGFRFATHATS